MISTNLKLKAGHLPCENISIGENEKLLDMIKGCVKRRRNDQKAIYIAFYGLAMGIGLRYSGSRKEAIQIVNQGFFEVFTKINFYKPNDLFKDWISRIMIKTSINFYRGKIKISKAEDAEKINDFAFAHFDDEPPSYKLLLTLIQQLLPAHRLVYNLYAIDGYNHEDIGELLGISTKASISLLTVGREKLKIMLTDDRTTLMQRS